MISGYEAYKQYLALKQHFTTTSFDYIKYNGKVNVSKDTYNKRNDRLFFDKLAKHEDLKNYLVSLLSYDSKTYIRDIVYSEKSNKIYSDWLKRQQSLTYIFSEDLKKLEDKFDSNFVCIDNQHPPLLLKFLSNDICLETICLLLEMTGAIKHWDKELKEDFIWKEYLNKIVKYTPFINIDRAKIKKIVLDYY